MRREADHTPRLDLHIRKKTLKKGLIGALFARANWST